MKSTFEKTAPIYACVLIILFAVVALAFSFHQNLWVDESTQLSGLSLSITDIYLWLGAVIDHPFIVPADRMPVLSYIVGVVWSSVFGLDIWLMRCLSIVLVLAALVFLAHYFLKNKQPVVLLATLLFLCLSPNLTVIAVEIRAYALFFLLSTVAVVLYLRIIACVENNQTVFAQLIILALVLALAINTHFFGVVLTGSLLVTYFLSAMVNNKFPINAKIVLSVGLILVLAFALIILPLMASVAMSSAEGAQSSPVLKPAIKLIYRLVAHQSMQQFNVLPYLALLMCFATIAVSLVRNITRVKISLLFILAIGFAVAFVANIALSGFDALAPHYNIWMLPVLALLFGFCVADLPVSKSCWAVALFVLCTGFGQYHLAVSGQKYAHNRFDQVEKRIQNYQAQGRLSVIYHKPMAKTWFAAVYRFPELDQYIVTPEGYRHLQTGVLTSKKAIEHTSDFIVSAYGEDVYSRDIAANPPVLDLPDNSPVYKQIQLPANHWQIIDAQLYIAQESAHLLVYKKTP